VELTATAPRDERSRSAAIGQPRCIPRRRSSEIATRLKTAGWIARSVTTDLRYGGILSGNIPSRHGQAGAYNVVNTPYAVLPEIFVGRIGPDDVLVDVGCGKGRVINWWLSRGLRNRMYGIELDPEVAAATRRRLRRFGNVTIITGDATSSVPDDATLLYMYNPFDAAAVARLKENLTERFAWRGITVLYWNLEWLAAFQDDPRWTSEVIELTRVSDPRVARAHRQYAVIRLRPTATGRFRRGGVEHGATGGVRT
jgi:protein-L-isoaspartate O-methyltransferase